MLKKTKIILSSIAATALLTTSVGLSIGLTSCSNQSSTATNPVLDLYSNFQTAKNKILTNRYQLPTAEQSTQLKSVLQNYISQFQSLQSTNKDLNSIQTVWLNTILYNLQQELKNFELNMRYLGGSEADNGSVYPCDAFNNYVVWNAEDANSLDTSSITEKSVNAGISRLKDFTDYLTTLENNFKEGVKNSVAQSRIIQRLFIANTIETFYPNELKYWATTNQTCNNDSAHSITGYALINGHAKNASSAPAQEKGAAAQAGSGEESSTPSESKPAVQFTSTNYMLSNVKNVQDSKVSSELKTQYKQAVQSAQDALNNFVIYFMDDYFANAITPSSTYGYGGTCRPILYKNCNGNDSQNESLQEVERTYTVPGTNSSIYGLGLSQQDLNAQKVGLGFMKNSEAGKNMYLHLLNLSTTTTKSAQEVFNSGIQDTQNGVDNMKSLANAVVALQTNNKYTTANGITITPVKKPTGKEAESSNTNQITTWKPVIAYDADGIGKQAPEVKQLTFTYVANENEKTSSTAWDNNWTTFNAWLNNEDFFWGRERQPSTLGTTTPSTDAQSPKETAANGQNASGSTNSSQSGSSGSQSQSQSKLGSSYFTQDDYNVLLGDTATQDQLNKYDLTVAQWQQYKQVLKDTGYWDAWNVEGNYGNIPAKSALCGAITELRDYWKFVNNFASYLNKNYTESVSNFTIRPYDYVNRNVSGVGASGGPSDNTFYLNVDPYCDLQKWSETSFTAHETFLGHRTQGEYVVEHPAKVNGKTGPNFSFTAYAEGWAVFVEWFLNQISTYGTVNPNGGIPLDFNGDKSLGFIPGDINGGSEGAKEIQTFQNGIYWNSINQNNNFTLTNDHAGWSIATQLGNMLQYYGYLNEAQLRNMRQAVDTALHSDVTNAAKTGNGQATLQGGASISQVRAYLHANSALGIGDVSNESIRYLAYPGQATSYMTGKNVMEEIYNKVNAQYKAAHNNQQIFENSTAIKHLFDIYLRTGDIPLDVLKQAVYNEYNIQEANAPSTASFFTTGR